MKLTTTLALLAATLMGTTPAFASSLRAVTADTVQNTSGGTALAVPATGANLVGDTTSQTLTNKSISGATNTLTAIPASAISSGQIGVANGGTGLASGTSGGILGFTASGTIASSAALTANALVVGGGAGATPSALGSTGTTTTVLHGNAAGAPTFGAVGLTTDVSGILPSANGGTGVASPTTGSIYVGAGSSPMTAVAPGTSGNVLTSNGSTWTSAAAPSGAPALNGGSGSAVSVTAAGGVTLSGITYQNFAWVVGSPGAVTVTKTPSITAGTADGQQLKIVGTSATNTVTLQDQANLASSGLSLNGNWVGGKDSTLNLHWDATQSLWIEDARR